MLLLGRLTHIVRLIWSTHFLATNKISGIYFSRLAKDNDTSISDTGINTTSAASSTWLYHCEDAELSRRAYKDII
jgi:hypothetical protein